MPKAVVFGARGGIGLATVEQFLRAGYVVIPVASEQIDFTNTGSYDQVATLLDNHQPDVIINSVGHFDNGNTESHSKTFDVNVGSNWTIIQHYINCPVTKPVHIVMVGSSAYKSGRRLYILYAASKAALYNVWQGAKDYFAGTNISVSLINPVRTRTPMIDMSTTAFCYEPEDVAQEILRIASASSSQLVDMKYPEEN
jgi:short-subunit dehydrogenase